MIAKMHACYVSLYSQISQTISTNPSCLGTAIFTFPVVILARILSIIPTTNCQKSSMHSIIKRFGAQ